MRKSDGVHRQPVPGSAVSCLGCVASFVGLAIAFLPLSDSRAAEPLAAWSQSKVRPVSSGDHHSIHTYFNCCPESPDGKWVLFYTSKALDAGVGEIRVLDRQSGEETVLATNVATEDAHRAACQQWIRGGKEIVFHRVINDEDWEVVAVEMESKRERVLAKGLQLGFGQPMGEIVPLYGPHWNPGEHRGLELLNVATGEIQKTALTAEAVEAKYPVWIAKQFGGKPVSVFFPLLSPDGERVLIKLATPAGGNFRSKAASVREGVICYNLKTSEFEFQQDRWGHPAWHPDSQRVLNTGGRVTTCKTGETIRLPGRWLFPGTHPSYGPKGELFTTDTLANGEPWSEAKGWWAVAVGRIETGDFVTLHRFDNARGARSWRGSHPHPVFSQDGKRVYFNVSDGPRTRLHVAEIP